MAEVYKVVTEGPGKGRKIQQAMGMQEDVQARLFLEAEQGAHRAQANLAIVRSKPGYNMRGGHSFIEIDRGKVDWYVILNDERGLHAAMSIEFGRKPADRLKIQHVDNGFADVDPGMPGLYILHDAMHLSRGGDVSDVEIGTEAAEISE